MSFKTFIFVGRENCRYLEFSVCTLIKLGSRNSVTIFIIDVMIYNTLKW